MEKARSEATQEPPVTYPGQAKFKSYLPQGPAGIEVILEPGIFILKTISKASLRLQLFCMMKYMHQYKQKR